jgi:urease alpha subunit
LQKKKKKSLYNQILSTILTDFDSFIKINWDTTVDKNSRKMGIGVVIRDGMGEVMVTLLAPKEYTVEVILRR